MAGLQLEWERATPSTATPTPDVAVLRPLVVLLPWVWAEPAHVNKHVELCHQHGWDVLVARWPMLALWCPPWSRALAAKLLAALGGELAAAGERPVVMWSFSGAAKGVYASLLDLLAAPQQLAPQQAAWAAALLRCCVGQVFDSGPVDFTSDMGRRLLAPAAPGGPASSSSRSSAAAEQHPGAAQAAAARLQAAAAAAAAAGVNVAAGALDFCLLEVFDRDCEAMWSALKHPPVGGPVLLLYSRTDPLADAAQIASLAGALRSRGRHVLEQVWQDSPHVGHLRADPAAYADAVGYLLAQALQEYSARSSRSSEGRRWAAGWQQQPQQQQCAAGSRQQPQQARPTVGSSSSVSSNYGGGSAPGAQQQQWQEQQPQLVVQPCSAWPGRVHSCGVPCSSGASFAHVHCCEQQQQPQLAMQPTRGVSATGRLKSSARGHHQPDTSSSGACASGSSCRGATAAAAAPAATLTRARTSGTTAAATPAAATPTAHRAQVLLHTPWLQQQLQEAQEAHAVPHAPTGSSGYGRVATATTGDSSTRAGHSSASAAAAAAAGTPPAVVRISGWPATATAVAAAMSADGGGTPVFADTTLLSHSLRCLASSFVTTHLQGGGGGGSGGSGGGGSQHKAAGPRHDGQQQPPFMQRVVSRIRSRL